jgi:uncharacterized protein
MTDNNAINEPAIKLHCPTCQKVVYWTADYPFRPFCSERCKLIDLGEWASENHKIPGPPADFTEDPEQ